MSPETLVLSKGYKCYILTYEWVSLFFNLLGHLGPFTLSWRIPWTFHFSNILEILRPLFKQSYCSACGREHDKVVACPSGGVVFNHELVVTFMDVERGSKWVSQGVMSIELFSGLSDSDSTWTGIAYGRWRGISICSAWGQTLSFEGEVEGKEDSKQIAP